VGTAGQRKRGRGGRSGGLLAVAAGPRVKGKRGEGAQERKEGVGRRGPCGGNEGEEESWAGLLGWAAFSSFFFFPFSFSILNLFKQNYLNSNEFKFKPYTLHTNKTNAPA
jgi:hypothetical protein